MLFATINLGREGMGDEAGEEDFHAWASYVQENLRIEGMRLEVSVKHRREGDQTDTIRAADSEERQEIRNALNDLWTNFCADATLWPERAGVTDIAFEDAQNTGDITYRLHPMDVGSDLRTKGVTVVVLATDGPIRVSYPGPEGERRVLEGPQALVLERLTAIGFDIRQAGGR